MNGNDADQCHKWLQEIDQLAAEIARVQNLLPDLKSMRGIDKKAERIFELSQLIQTKIGTGDSPKSGTDGHSSSGHG